MQKFFGFDSTIGVGRNFGFKSSEVELPLEKPVITSVTKDIDMAGMRLEFAQFGRFDSFSVYRSAAPMDVNSLPPPIATGLTSMYYIDTEVDDFTRHFYRVACYRGSEVLVSDEVISELNATVPAELIPDDYILRHDFNGDYIDKSLNANNLYQTGTGTASFENGRKAGTQAIRFESAQLKTTKKVIITSNKIAISFWMKNRNTSSSVVYGAIFQQVPESNQNYLTCYSDIYGFNTLYFIANRGDTHINSVYSGYTTVDDWLHVVMEMDTSIAGTQAFSVYVNNTLKTLTKESVTGETRVKIGSLFWCLGKNYKGVDPFVGSLQDLRVYDRGLTAEEREQLFNE